jgi:protocatechuate 3,4-dioxygenase beta subunit
MMIKRQLVILFLGLLAWQAAYAQSPAGCKTGLVYENRNPTDPDPIELIDVKGVAKDKAGAAMPDVCVGLFTEAEHKLMAQIATDEKGHFNFRSIAPGFYRLVAHYDSFCTSNTRIHVVVKTPNDKEAKQALAIHMTPAGGDSCSYADYK